MFCEPAAAGGGGGGVDRVGGAGGRGADAAGGGGGGAAGLAEGGGGGAGAEGFLDETGGGGGLDDPGNGGARGGASDPLFIDAAAEATDDGREAGFGGGFRRFATNGFGGAGGDSVEGGGGGGRAPGGLGADGGFGAGAAGALGRELSDSGIYGESRLAPVSTPPRLRSFGIPAAKSPPSCGAAGAAALLSCPETPSLLLRSLFADCPEGTGGARPAGGFAMPGTGGAPPT